MRAKTVPWDSILKYFPSGNTLIDVGCGHGLLINLLSRQHSKFKRYIGIDPASNKLDVAKQLENESISFYPVALSDMNEQADVYSIFDVLYLIPYDIQESIIKEIFLKLPPKGYLVIKEVDTKPYWKFSFVRLQETLSVKLLNVTLGNKFFFRSEEEYKKLLKETGFEVETVFVDKGYPYPHILFICNKSF